MMEFWQSNPMVRAFSLLGMTSGFLVISPGLRGTVMDGFALAAAELDKHSPYSYVGVAFVLLGGLMLAFLKGSAAR
jgi:uncharacterized membrane protein YdcZ (DUF606 family)